MAIGYRVQKWVKPAPRMSKCIWFPAHSGVSSTREWCEELVAELKAEGVKARILEVEVKEQAPMPHPKDEGRYLVRQFAPIPGKGKNEGWQLIATYNSRENAEQCVRVGERERPRSRFQILDRQNEAEMRVQLGADAVRWFFCTKPYVVHR